jgi:hypothetical protein
MHQQSDKKAAKGGLTKIIKYNYQSIRIKKSTKSDSLYIQFVAQHGIEGEGIQ